MSERFWLDELNLEMMTQQWGKPGVNVSVSKTPLTVNGKTYERGVGSHSISELNIRLHGQAAKFTCLVGIDDSAQGPGSVTFEIWGDDELLMVTPVIRTGQNALPVEVDLTGVQTLLLIMTDAGDGIPNDHGDWLNAVIEMSNSASAKPETFIPDPEPAPPIYSGIDPEPRINGPRVVGTTPGFDFLFLIPATGERPLQFKAENLPDGLALDSDTGIISGSLKQAGEYIVSLMVSGPKGECRRELKIIGGQRKLAQTPPMGWNSWNVWAEAVDDEKIRAAADWMIKTGLAAVGYQYVNIDDCWENGRDEDGFITSNEKFPDMKALSDYVHSLGLKLGIYSSPGPWTCQRYEGSYLHEEQDAKTWADWGIDYLKHDWCGYRDVVKDDSREELMKPYRIMREALDKCARDIVYSLCQYGMGNVWEWGQEVGANCWRTTGDIKDNWFSMSGIGFGQAGLEKYAGPGHWNDPDMMVVGKLGWGPKLHPTNLTPNEQLLHVTLWTLLASPILLGCDLSDLDQFTLDLLRNVEVVDIHQDPLGVQAGRVSQEDGMEVWSRPLWDGTLAVGLFNRNRKKCRVTAKWAELGIDGKQLVRNVWLREDIGEFEQEYSVEIPAHGAALVKIGQPSGRI